MFKNLFAKLKKSISCRNRIYESPVNTGCAACCPCLVQEQILGLHIPVDDGEGVEVVQRRHNLSRVEEGGGVAELARPPQVREELTAADVGEQHVEAALVLVCPAKAHDKGMADLLQDRLLVLDVLHLLELDDVPHGEELEGVVGLCILVAAQAHAGKCT
jgi:hypothetical protein